MQNGPVAAALDAKIEEAKQKLAELERLSAATADELAQLERLRAARLHAESGSDSGQYSPADKLQLFGDLFRGRDDVFAVRWENRARNRAGYSPRCMNEWARGVCGKPKVRCGVCSHQAFLRLDDRQLLAHLQGRQVVGIYPLFPGDTCRLLAIDLDGNSLAG